MTLDYKGERFAHIPTRELTLLLKNAESQGYTSAPHAIAYRTELKRRHDATAKA